MSLIQWLDNGWLRKHVTSKEEIANLMAIVNRDIEDAQVKEISNDWRFGIAYNAALKLATIMLYASGYRTEKNLAHYRTILSLELTIGEHRAADVAYLDACRIKRNIVEYDNVGYASSQEALELLEFAKELKEEVISILQEKYSHLL